MNEELYTRVVDTKDSIRDIFSSLNMDGYRYIDELPIEETKKDDVVRFVAYRYSYQSSLIRKQKDSIENKKFILKKLGFDISDRFTSTLINNTNTSVNKFISWWLKETAHPLFRRVISGMDLETEKLQIVRDGLILECTGNAKELDKFAKQVTKDSTLKTKAYMDAVIIRNQITSDSLELERTGYGKVEIVIREDIPNEMKQGESFAEYISRTSEKNESKQRKNYSSLHEGTD